MSEYPWNKKNNTFTWHSSLFNPFKSKPWITLGLQKSISVKNKLLTKFINVKHLIERGNSHWIEKLQKLGFHSNEEK